MARRMLAMFLSLVMVFSFTMPIYADATEGNGIDATTPEVVTELGNDSEADEQVHTHIDTCYEEKLVCTLSAEAHVHDESECYGDLTAYICGIDSGEGAHSHGDGCYAEAVLTCTQEEIDGHAHGDGCYETASEPSCGQNSGDGAHAHDDGCYTEEQELSCNDAEEGHEHGSDCYTAVSTLSCGQSESGGHEHGSGCYERVQTCTQDEFEGHTHGGSCYAAPELVCALEETDGHIHTSDCEETSHQLLCELSTEAHVHGAECYEKTLICELETPAEAKPPVEADPVCPGDDTCTIEGCENHTPAAPAACEECGASDGHAETCPQYAPPVEKCEHCGIELTEGAVHLDTCITLCTCETAPEAKCPIHSCPDCGVNAGELHLKGCEQYIPVCNCGESVVFHAEDCDLYLEPVTAEVYTETDGVYTEIENHSKSEPIDVEEYDGETVYILASDEPQELYFGWSGYFGHVFASFSMDENDLAKLATQDGWLGSKVAVVTISEQAEAGEVFVLHAAKLISGEFTVTIEVIDEIPIDGDPTVVEMEDGNIVSVEGIPEGAQLTVTIPEAEKSQVVDFIANDYFAIDSSLADGGVLSLNYDIKIMKDGKEWQPEDGESVYVTIETPDFYLDYRTYLQGIHILDTESAINRAIESGDAISMTEVGLAEKFPAETEAALAAGFPEDTIVYTIMLPETGDMFIQDGSIVIDASSFSTSNITAFNVDNSEHLGEVDEAGLKLDKTATMNYTTGDSYVELSSYVKGEVNNTPTDVVLVIDHSGSMWTAVEPEKVLTFDDFKDDTKYGAHEGYYVAITKKEQTVTYKGESRQTNTAYLIRYADNEWQISKGFYGEPGVSIDADNAFINTVIGSDRKWSKLDESTAEGLNFYVSISGKLYEALNLFMNEMENAEDCRVAVCTFAGYVAEEGRAKKTDHDDLVEGTDYKGSGIFIDGVLTWDGTTQTRTAEGNVDKDRYQNAFEDPSTEDGQEILYNTIDAINTDYGNTPTAIGLLYARRLFNEGGRSEANKVAVVFTDGLPSPNYLRPRGSDSCTHDNTSYYVETGDGEYATEAAAKTAAYEATGGSVTTVDGKPVYTSGCEYCEPVKYMTAGDQVFYRSTSTYVDQANQLKTANKATVYSIGPTSGRAGVDVLEKIASGNDRYFNASGDDIAKVFRDIAGFIVSSSKDLDETTVSKDIISDSFKLPDDVTLADIKVYTAAYTGTVNGEDQFDLVNMTELTGAKVTLDKDTKTIEVSGFDYGENAVAMEGAKPVGSKLIIRIPIEPEPDFLGGNNVWTNKADSGIYAADGSQIQLFPEPDVDVPVKSITPKFVTGNIYLSEQAVVPHVANAGHFSYQYNGKTDSTVVDGINNEYVDIIYTITDATGNGITCTIEAGSKTLPVLSDWTQTGTGTLKLTPLLQGDATYHVKCEVVPTATGTYEQTKTESNQTIQVYKPHITFRDSVIDLGDTADYADNLVLNNEQTYGGYGTNVVWKHGNDIAKISDMGEAPTLTYTYDPAAGAFSEETEVRITKIVPSLTESSHNTFEHDVPEGQDILEFATFYRDTCDFRLCDHDKLAEVTETAPHFIVHLNTFDLVIQKTGADLTLDPNQTFIFRVTGPDNFSMDVVIEGNGKVKILALPVGKTDYIVTELTDWSWRYDVDGDTQVTVDLTESEGGSVTVSFKNKREERKWLSGDCYVVNWFDPAGIKKNGGTDDDAE